MLQGLRRGRAEAMVRLGGLEPPTKSLGTSRSAIYFPCEGLGRRWWRGIHAAAAQRALEALQVSQALGGASLAACGGRG